MGGNDETEILDIDLIGASVVHDFNKIFTPIVSVMSDLQRDCTIMGRQKEKIDGAILCSLRARALAYQLLDLSRFCRAQEEIVDLGALLSPLEAVYSSMLGSAIHVTLNIPNDLPLVRLDPHLMERAILNLVLNARNAMYDGGQLVISASVDRTSGGETAMLRMTVTDTGERLNIALDHDATVYSAKIPRGNGLGLAMVTRFVKAAGGYVTVVGNPEGGTSVSLCLPTLKD